MRRLLVTPRADEGTGDGDCVYACPGPEFVRSEGRYRLCRGGPTKEDGADVQASVD